MSEMVALDSEFGREIGFTSDKFDGYLWRDDPRVLVSFIVSRDEGKGHLSKLFSAIESRGLRVAVPTPFPRMEAILRRKGFEPHMEEFAELGDVVEVWERPNALR